MRIMLKAAMISVAVALSGCASSGTPTEEYGNKKPPQLTEASASKMSARVEKEYPKTPQCKALLSYLKNQWTVRSLVTPFEAYPKYVRLEHACLASAPDHPLSRRKACGNGQYYHYINGEGFCGIDKARDGFITAAYHTRVYSLK